VELLFLGTSSGTPTASRNVSGLALIDTQSRAWFLIDCGEGTQHRLLKTRLSTHHLAAIFITHVHGDHCYGLPGLLASAGMNGRTAPLTLVAPRGISDWLAATLQFTQLHLPFAINYVAAEGLTNFACGAFEVDAVALSHRVPSFAYAFTEIATATVLDTEKLLAQGIAKGPLWGQIKRGYDGVYKGTLVRAADFLLPPGPARKIVVGGDNDTPNLLAQACQQCQVLVHEATYTRSVAEKIGKHLGHSYAAQVAEFAEAAGVAHLVLTHFSPRYQNNPQLRPSIQDIYAEAAAFFSGHLVLAEDFMQYRLTQKGDFIRVIAG
jgi:ribonuclease Z